MKNFSLFAVGVLVLVSSQVLSQEMNETLDGKWCLELEHSDIGFVRAFMQFDTDSRSFVAYTRKNADRDILGGSTSLLGRIFTNSFKDGCLLRIVKGNFENGGDTLKLKGILTSALGNYYFNGYVLKNELHARLTNGRHEQRGIIKGTKNKAMGSLDDYPALFEKAITLTDQRIYNKELLQSKDWKVFVNKMRKVTMRVQDDLEMVFAFYYYAGKLPVSHYALMKLPETDKNAVKAKEQYVFLEEYSPQTAYMKITSFGGTAEEMDSIFRVVNEKTYNNLIIDMRDNPGGSVEAGMAFATNIVDSTFYGGVFLTQKWFNKYSDPPTIENYTSMPHFSEANFNLIIEGIHKTEGLCLKVIPKKTVYSGNIYILVNGNTASTCEPIVYGLKQQKRAVIIGEKTAGSMLNGEIFELDKGFKMIIPTADYYASDGYRIDQSGVKPDIVVKREDALDYVKNLLR